eukprot:scaffold37218_cov52-Cyclotella_meneghiniana.AAC.7
MMKLFLFAAAILVPRTLSQELCTCAPTQYTFHLNLTANCNASTIDDNEGIKEMNNEMVVINQEVHSGNLVDGHIITYDSISKQLDYTLPLEDQMDLVPDGVVIYVRGQDKEGITDDYATANAAFCPVLQTPTNRPTETLRPIQPTTMPTSTVITPSDTCGTCPLVGRKYIPTFGCEDFYSCEEKTVLQCPVGLLFDVVLQVCNWPDAFTCTCTEATTSPTDSPTPMPTDLPTETPSTSAPPTLSPSDSPSATPTTTPSESPSSSPSTSPTSSPSTSPSTTPTKDPTTSPTTFEFEDPSEPTDAPVTAAPITPRQTPVTTSPTPITAKSSKNAKNAKAKSVKRG